MEIKDPHLSHVTIIGFVRYSLGRSSYIVSDCNELLRRLWHDLPAHTKQIIVADIVEALHYDDRSIEVVQEMVESSARSDDARHFRYLDDIDRRSWELTLDFIEKYQNHATNNNNND